MDQRTLREIEILLRPLQARIRNSIARSVVRATSDERKLQLLQVGLIGGELVEDAEHFQPFGFSSVPLAGAEAITIFPDGDRTHPITIAVSDRRHRPTGGEAGEVVVYNHTGAKITIMKDGDIEVQPAPGREVFVRHEGGTAVALATKADVAKIETAISGALVVANDGGASLQATILVGKPSSLHGVSGTTPWPLGTSVLKGE